MKKVEEKMVKPTVDEKVEEKVEEKVVEPAVDEKVEEKMVKPTVDEKVEEKVVEPAVDEKVEEKMVDQTGDQHAKDEKAPDAPLPECVQVAPHRACVSKGDAVHLHAAGSSGFWSLLGAKVRATAEPWYPCWKTQATRRQMSTSLHLEAFRLPLVQCRPRQPLQLHRREQDK